MEKSIIFIDRHRPTISLESIRISVIQSEAQRASTTWMAIYMVEVLKALNITCVIFSVGFGVEGGFCEQHKVLFRGHKELLVETMRLNLLCVVPVGDNTVYRKYFKV